MIDNNYLFNLIFLTSEPLGSFLCLKFGGRVVATGNIYKYRRSVLVKLTKIK